MNKNVTEADILGAAQEAFRTGRTTLKLYFMIGLPGEEDDDVAAIADLVLRMRDLGRRCLGARSGRLQLNVSVNNFIPKPFTPFQWSGMALRETLMSRQALLRSRLRLPGVRLALHGVDKSYLEAALARGGEDMAEVILAAWRRGARFDSWTEQFRGDAWEEAFSAVGLAAEELACRGYGRGDVLPWDRIMGVVDRDFLWEEWQRALRGESTPDCRWDGCLDCGACPAGLGNDLAAEFTAAGDTEASAAPPPGAAIATAPAGCVETPAAPATAEAVRQRYLLTFSVNDRACYVGHLDKIEVFRRAVRRAGGRLALTAGMRPKPLLSLALPLAVGARGSEELCEFELAEEPPDDFGERLAASLPAGLQVVSLAPYLHSRRAAARVVGASYEVSLAIDLPPDAADARLRQAAARFAESPSILVAEARAGRVRSLDVKKYVDRVDFRRCAGGGYSVLFTARVTPTGSVRPPKVAEALLSLAGLELEVTEILRTRILLA